MDQSLANHDLTQILGFYDSSYVGIDQHGKRESFADLRKLELTFTGTQFRSNNQRTIVEDVQSERDRMFVYFQSEKHFEFHDQTRNGWGWVPMIEKETGESTWERKGDQWKLVRSTAIRVDGQVDPKFDPKHGEETVQRARQDVEVRQQEEKKARQDAALKVDECCDSGRQHDALSVREPKASAPRVIAQKLYDQMDQAYANRNLNRMLGFYDSSYAGANPQGRRLTIADYRNQLEQTFSAIRLANPSTTIEDVRMDGGRIVVYYKFEMVYQLNDRQYGWVPVVNKRSGEDTWERKGGQWKIVRATVLRERHAIPSSVL